MVVLLTVYTYIYIILIGVVSIVHRGIETPYIHILKLIRSLKALGGASELQHFSSWCAFGVFCC